MGVKISQLQEQAVPSVNDQIPLVSGGLTMWAKVQALLSLVDWSNINNKPTDYNPADHTHDVIWEEILNKPSTFPATAHSHPWDGLQGISGKPFGAEQFTGAGVQYSKVINGRTRLVLSARSTQIGSNYWYALLIKFDGLPCFKLEWATGFSLSAAISAELSLSYNSTSNSSTVTLSSAWCGSGWTVALYAAGE